jgi:hypothetical protein
LPWGPKILLAALSLPVACSWSVVLFGTPASSTTITGRHDIAEILLKMALKHQKSNQIRCSFSEQIFNSTFPDFYFKKSNV